MKKLAPLAAAAAIAVLSTSIFRPAAAQPAPSAAGGLKTIDLPQLPIDLPEGPGKSAVVGSCVICHSPKYITMQPRFPRKTWEAEVDKMRKTFGAPVPEAAVPEIVNYLVGIRGTEPATRPTK